MFEFKNNNNKIKSINGDLTLTLSRMKIIYNELLNLSQTYACLFKKHLDYYFFVSPRFSFKVLNPSLP